MTPYFLNRLVVSFLLLLFSQFASSQCDADFTPSNTQVCGNQIVTFSANTTFSENSYIWRIDNGAIELFGEQASYAFLPDPNGYFVDIMLVVVGMNCRDSTIQSLEILPSPAFSIDGDFDECLRSNDASTTFATTFSVNPTSGVYDWNFGDGNVKLNCPDEFVSHTYTAFGSYMLTVSQYIGTCTTTVSRQVDFYRRPSADMNIATGNTDLCEGDTLTVQNGTTGNVVFYTINWGDGQIDTAYTTADLQHTFSFSDDDACHILENEGAIELDIRLDAFAGPNCGHFNGSPVFVTPKPRPDFNVDDCICIDDMPVQFENVSCNKLGNDYSWNFAGLGTSQALNPEFSFPTVGTYIIELEATSTSNCGSNIFSKTIEIVGPPTAIASFDPQLQTGCGSVKIPFSNSSTGGCLSYKWRVRPSIGSNFVDSTDENSREPVINFFRQGTYIVSMDATNNCGTDTWRDTIVVAGFPSVTLATIPDSCEQSTITSSATIMENGCPIEDCVWTFVGSSQTITHTGCTPPTVFFDIPGLASVSLTVTNCCGSSTATTTFNVQAPIDNINAGLDLEYCRNEPCVILNGWPAGGQWELNGMPQDTLLCPTDLLPGTYELVYFFDLGLCSAQDTITLTIHPLPQATDFPENMTVCENDTIFKLIAAPLGYWLGSGVDSSGCFDPSTGVVGPAGNKLTYYFSDSTTGCTNSETITITVNEVEEIQLLPRTFCDADTICLEEELDIESNSGAICSWIGPGIIDSESGKFVPVLAGYNNPDTTTYQFTFTCTYPSGCIYVSTIAITIAPRQSAEAGSDLRYCHNDPCETLVAAPLGGEWELNGTPFNGILCPSDLMPDTHHLVYHFTSGLCNTSDTILVIIDPLPQTTDFPEDMTVCENDTIFKLIAAPLGYWLGSGVDSSGCFDPSTGVVGPAGNKLTYYFSDSTTGCTNSETITITVNGVEEIQLLPRTFCDADTICLEEELDIESNSGAICSWIGPGIIDSESGKFVPVLAGYNNPDTTTYQFTFTCTYPSGCIYVSTIAITIVPRQSAEAGSDLRYCHNDPCETLVAAPLGGEWELNGTPFNGILCPSDLMPDTHHLVYHFTSGLCNTSDTILVIIDPLPQTTSFPLNRTVCENDSTFKLTTSPPGWWSGVGVDSSGCFDPSLASTSPNGNELIYHFIDSVTGCSNTDTLVINVSGITLSPLSAQIFCDADTISLEKELGIEEETNAVGVWSGPGGIIDPNNGIFVPVLAGYNSPATTIFQFTYHYTSPMGCELFISVDVTIMPRPEVDAGRDTTVCKSEGSLQLIANLQNDGEWKGINASISTNGIINLSEYDEGLYEYVFTAFKGETCEVKDTVAVYIVDLETVEAGPDRYVCETESTISLTGFSAPSGSTAFWSGQGIVDSINGTIDVQQLDAGMCYSFIYKAISTTLTRCKILDSMMLCVDALPSANFAINGSGCINDLLTFIPDVSNQQGLIEYCWDFGDGNNSCQFNPTHAYVQDGDYTIRLTVITFNPLSPNDTLCIHENTQEIHITAPPIINFTVTPDTGCADLTLVINNMSTGENINYEWYLDNILFSTDFNPSPLVLGSGRMDTTYTLRLTIVNGCGGGDSSTVILVKPEPVALSEVDLDDYCSGDTIRVNNNSYGNLTRYEWYKDGILISTDSMPPVVTHFTDTLEYTEICLIVYNECKADTICNTVRVSPTNVDAFFYTDTTMVCVGDSICFTNFSTFGANVLFDFGDGNTSTNSNPCHTYQDSGTYKIILWAFGCGRDSFVQIVHVFPLPKASFIARDFACPGDTLIFTSTSEDVVDYFWNFDDGNTSTLASPSHVFKSAGIYQVCLTVSSQNRCQDQVCKTIIIEAPPIAGFSVPDTICIGDTLRVVNESIGSVSDCFYQFGDGGVSGLCEAWHVYDSSDNFEIIQIVSNNAGCPDTARHIVFVRSVPQADFEHIIADTCHPSVVEFINLSANAEDYLWDFDDGTTSAEANPLHIYQLPGVYLVSLIAIKDGACERIKTQAIEIFEQPKAIITADTTAVCAPMNIQFTSGSTGLITSYFWDFGDGFVSFMENPSHLFQTPGRFPVTFIVSNSHCRDTAISFIEVNEPLIVGSEITHNLCFGDQLGSIDLSIESGTLPFNFNWSNGLETEDIFNLPAGQYAFIVTDSNRCTWIDTLSVEQPEAISIAISDAVPATCFGDSDGLVCTEISGGTPNYSLLWETGSTENCLVNVAAGQYGISVTDDNDCVVKELVEVFQNPPVSVIDTFGHVSCFGADDAFIHLHSIQGGASDRYTISLVGPEGEEGDRYFFDKLGAGDYHLTIQDEEGCLLEKAYRITEPDSLWVDIIGDTLFIDLGKDTFFTVKHNASNPTFAWTPEESLSCYTCSDPIASPFLTTTYQLIVTEDNGCIARDEVVVNVKIDRVVYIPNAFTPDGNGINDVFMVFAKEKSVTQVRKFEVFDRWGELVFANYNFLPNMRSEGWDGRLKGEMLQPAVFVYHAVIEFADGESKDFKGDVTLLTSRDK